MSAPPPGPFDDPTPSGMTTPATVSPLAYSAASRDAMLLAGSLCESGPTIPGYEVLGELGRGGMGVVFKARQLALGRVVAMKMVLQAEYAGPQELARFLAEAEAVARLQHPNVVQLFEAGHQEGLPFLALEFVPGGSLADRLRGHPYSPREAAEILRQVAFGVQHAHDRGVVHRDLKPGNILLTEDGTPKVTDFGLARRIEVPSGLTATGTVLGTPSYMAPEQALGSKEVGPAADVYAMGAILYECLTGRPPFWSASQLDTLQQVISDDPAPPRQLNPGVPKDLEAICLKCLHKEQHRRYSSAAELAADISRFLDGEPVAASKAGLFDRLLGGMDRVQMHARFAVYGSLCLWLAPVMFLPELWVTTVVANDWPHPLLVLGVCGRVAAFLLLVGWHRGWRWTPQGAGERQVWAIMGGYLLACLGLGLSGRVLLGLHVSVELRFYQGLSALTALAFFSLAASFWGYCAVVGLGFLALMFVMAIDLRWAPVEFGAAWAAVLILLGIRLRRLGRGKPTGG